MSVQSLKIWCESSVTDGTTETDNRRDLTDEEFLSGLVRLDNLSTQQYNSLMFLLSSHAAPYAHCAYQMPSGVTTPSIALDLDGSTFTEDDYPNLYDIYSGTLPDLSSEAVTGFKWVIRAS